MSAHRIFEAAIEAREQASHRVLFVTQRPQTRGAPVQKQTQLWLRRHGFDFPSVYTTRGSRGAIALALNLDVVVDDRFEGCVDVASESSARPIFVWREPDGRVLARSGVSRVEDCPLPFAAVVHDVVRRAAVPLERGPLDLAIRASCTVPLMDPNA